VAESPGVTLREITGLGVTALHGRPDPLPGLPQGPGSASLPQGTAIWTAPGQWLLLHAPDATPPVDDSHRTDLTGARRILELGGPRAREALATLLPIDLHPAAFGDQAAAATIAAHIPVLVWRDGEAFRIACYRSYGESLREALLVAGRGRDR
jgi:sarcosine oxidase subunit gamma